MTNVNGRFFFSADNSTNGEELWMLIAPRADDCDDAVEVVVGESYYGTTEEAIGGDIPDSVFDTNDVWYKSPPSCHLLESYSSRVKLRFDNIFIYSKPTNEVDLL